MPLPFSHNLLMFLLLARMMADAFYVLQNSPDAAPVSDDRLASGPRMSMQHFG